MTWERVLSRTARPADRSLRYGQGAEHVAELWRPPDGSPRATVVVLHGGFWRADYGLDHIRPLCAALADSGYLSLALEYHRVGHREGGWPGTFHDIAAGLDTLPRLTDEPVVGERTVLLGHSAGGHLALWASMRHRLPGNAPGGAPEAPAPRGVVSLAGICDLAAAARLRLGDGAVEHLLGGPATRVRDRYRLADPSRLLPMGRRCVLVHGTADDRVPDTLSRRFHALAEAGGDDVRWMPVRGAGHFDLIDPLAPAWHTVIGAVRHIFDSTPKEP